MEKLSNCLRRLQWDVACGNPTGLQGFVTDSIVWVFTSKLTPEQEDAIVKMLEDLNGLNYKLPTDIYWGLIILGVDFKVSFKYCTEVSLKKNFYYFQLVRDFRRVLKNSERPQ